MSTPAYTLTVKNNSVKEGYILVFCNQPDSNQPDIQTYAWQSKFLYTGVKANFTWKVDWAFMWKQTNAVNVSQQIVPADLEQNNLITLSYDANHRAFHFSAPTQGPNTGSLYIQEDNSVPMNMVDVGIALAGHAAFMVKSMPNMTLAFTPKPSYWLAFGNSEPTGPVTINEYADAVKLEFPPNIYALTATINPNNTISIENSPIFAANEPDH